MNFKFTEYVELPVTICYIYEPPDPSVGYKGGITVEETTPHTRSIDWDSICQAHYEGECERLECEKADYYDAMAETQLILKHWNELEGR